MNKNTISNTASRLHDEHKHQLEELEKNLKEKKDELSLVIREYPVTSVLVALGVGILIGNLFSSRK